MKKLVLTFCLGLLTIVPTISHAEKRDHHETRIIETKINYARSVVAHDRNGFAVYMAAIGGQIVFEGGNPPVYATLKVGGQIYTAPTDFDGNYSFYVYTNGYNQFSVEGWASHGAAEARGKSLSGIIK